MAKVTEENVGKCDTSILSQRSLKA